MDDLFSCKCGGKFSIEISASVKNAKCNKCGLSTVLRLSRINDSDIIADIKNGRFRENEEIKGSFKHNNDFLFNRNYSLRRYK